MGQMISYGNELVRISPKDASIVEYSTNEGRTWNRRGRSTSNMGDFQDLIDNGDELLAKTAKGLFYSKNNGRSWNKRS